MSGDEQAPVQDNHRRPYVVSVRLSRREDMALQRLVEQSGAANRAEYVRARLLGVS